VLKTQIGFLILWGRNKKMSQFNKKSEHLESQFNSNKSDTLHNRKEIKCGEYVAVTKEVNPLAAIFAENFARNGKNLTIEELDKLVKFLNNYTQEELKFAALIMASKLVAKKRGLSLEQQMLVWIPLSWREE
tara:strand:- start:468 stop:863 length:396 start_codon:yes stop_codon:yes gene_type:complete